MLPHRLENISKWKATQVALEPIAQALDRWLTLGVTSRHIPPRVWDTLDKTWGELLVHQVRGNAPKAEMIRAWLGYRTAQMAHQCGQRLPTEATFHAAYLAWQNWQARGRYART